jgi:hypothetical protein
VAAEFVPLADLLRAPVRRGDAVDLTVKNAGVDDATAMSSAGEAIAVRDEPLFGESVVDTRAVDVVAAVRDARLFRARLADAFDEAAARLLRDLATDVLARELRLAPCDLADLVQRACERAPVVRVRVAASDVARVAAMPVSRCGDVQVVADPALAGGDAVVEVVGGALDARLGVRLATVLEAFA